MYGRVILLVCYFVAYLQLIKIQLHLFYLWSNIPLWRNTHIIKVKYTRLNLLEYSCGPHSLSANRPDIYHLIILHHYEGTQLPKKRHLSVILQIPTHLLSCCHVCQCLVDWFEDLGRLTVWHLAIDTSNYIVLHLMSWHTFHNESSFILFVK